MIKERRNYFRIEDTVLLRLQPVDESAALANIIPYQFNEDPSYSLIRELQSLDQDNQKFLRLIAEDNRDLEAYLKGINKKIELIAATVIESEGRGPDQIKQKISISEGGLSFCSDTEFANDSYLALQVTLLPSHHTMVIFSKVINCSKNNTSGFSIALSLVHLKDTDRQIITRHIMQLQLAERRKNSNAD
jgi:hypothetical protein